MRRTRIALLVGMLILAVALPVSAAKPDVDCDKLPTNHPACPPDDPEDPPPSEEPDPNWATPCGGAVETESPFTVELGGRKSGLPDFACIDVMSDPGQWTVEVDVDQGTLRSMSVHIRDSVAPGDGCFPGGSCGLDLRDFPEENPFTLTAGMEAIPGAYVNACNVFPDDNYFGEWAIDRDGVWTFFDDIHPELPSPLAFMPSISGSNDLKVTLTVTFPEVDPQP